MKTKPWIAVNVLTNTIVGQYASEVEGLIAHKGEPVEVQYAPNARKMK